MKKFFPIIICIFASLAILSSCKEVFKVTDVRIFPKEAIIHKSDSLQLRVAIDFDCDGVKYEDRLEYSWLSSDESVATVSSEGLVKGLNVGHATISFICADKSETVEITVDDIVESD